jgi:F-type H+-transporting ATPase subunit delta
MIEKTLAKRYATAMLAVALKEGVVEEIEQALLALKQAYLGDVSFRRALGQPKIPRGERKRILKRPFEGKVNSSFLQFLDILVEKQRVGLIPDIADVFDQLADATQGVVRVHVDSAWPLTDAQRAALVQKFGRVTGKKIELQEAVDRALRGGLSVRIGDNVLEGTAASRLKRLKEHLYQVQKA